MNTFLTLVMAICFLISGWSCISKPEVLQRWLLELQQKNQAAAQLNPLRKWVGQRSFLLALRVIGLLCLINALLLFYLLNETPSNGF